MTKSSPALPSSFSALCIQSLCALACAALLACGHSKPKAAEVLLRLRGGPDEARVRVNDVPLGTLGQLRKGGVRLAPGQHRLSVEADGYFPLDELIDVPTQSPQLQRPIELEALPEP